MSVRVIDYGRLTRRAIGVDARRLEYAVVDLETTGLDPAAGDRVCEVAVVRMRGDGTVLAEHSTLIDPGPPPARSAHNGTPQPAAVQGPVEDELGGSEFHSIRWADMAGAPRFAEVAPGLLPLLSGAVVVGHKLAFEDGFLSAEFARLGWHARLPGLCTLTAVRSQLDLSRYGLSAATEAVAGRSPADQHTALGDARACALLLASLLTAAPAPLHYAGPPPAHVPALPTPHPNGTRPNGTRPNGAHPHGIRPRAPLPVPGAGHRIADLIAAAPAVHADAPGRWNRHELDPDRCLGRYGTEERVAAVSAARRAYRFRLLGRAAAALAPALLVAALPAGPATRTR